MFNLDEALRNHLAQRQKEPKARFVAASVATLSPRSKPGRTSVVAGDEKMRPLLSQPLNDGCHRGASFMGSGDIGDTGNTLCFRPTDWAQIAIVSAHWRALLHDLAEVDQEQKNGSGL
jgi:adenylosuccinate lyase